MDSLGTFSEFALALAGFAAIALVLGQRQGAIPPGAIYIVRFMVVNALGPALLALLALVLAEATMPEPLLWRVCSAIYLAVAVFFGLLSLRQQRALASSGELIFTGPLNVGVWLASLAAHLVELLNLVGFPLPPSLGLFLLGLWILLAVAGVQFVALLFLVLR